MLRLVQSGKIRAMEQQIKMLRTWNRNLQVRCCRLEEMLYGRCGSVRPDEKEAVHE